MRTAFTSGLAGPTGIGLILILVYAAQIAMPLKWGWLVEAQDRESYKLWTGAVMGFFILFQWVLTVARMMPLFYRWARKAVDWHKWVGSFSPILLFFHSASFGHGYLFIFSLLFVANMLLGTLNLDIIKSQKNWIFQTWMITHVSFSFLITGLLLFHIGIVFYYK